MPVPPPGRSSTSFFNPLSSVFSSSIQSLWQTVKGKFFSSQSDSRPTLSANEVKPIHQETIDLEKGKKTELLSSLVEVVISKGTVRHAENGKIVFVDLTLGLPQTITFQNEKELHQHLIKTEIFDWEIHEEQSDQTTYLHWNGLLQTFESHSAKHELYYTLAKETSGAFKLINRSTHASTFVLDRSGYFSIGFEEFTDEEAFLKAFEKKNEKCSFALKCFALLAAGAVVGVGLYKTYSPMNESEDIESSPDRDPQAFVSRHIGRHLLSTATIASNPIPNQLIQINTPYNYSLDHVFTGDFTLVSATLRGGAPLPSWLQLQYKQIGAAAGSFHNVVLQNDLLFAVGGNGLQIFNVSDPSNPTALGNFSTVGSAQGVAVSGNTAFVAAEIGLQVIDITNTSNPKALGYFFADSGTAWGVTVSDNTAFIANGAGLQMIDITNPGNPTALGTFSAGLGGASSVTVSGNMAFVTNGIGLQIIDITNTSNPKALGNFSTGLGFANGVVVSGNTAFVADLHAGLQIIDITNTSNPTALGIFPAGLGSAQGVAVSGNTAFVAAEIGLQIIDITNTSNPKALGYYFFADSGTAWGVTVSGTTVFVADGNVGLQVADTRLCSLLGTPPSGFAFQSFEIQIKGCNNNGCLSSLSFTLSIDQPPYSILNTLLDQSLFPNASLSFTLNSNLLFANPSSSFLSPSLSLTNGGQLPPWLKISISPTLASTFPAGSGSASDVAVLGNTAFVADSTGLQIIDITTPSNPRLLSTFPAGSGTVSSVVVSGNTAFVADGIGLQIIDITNTSNPKLLSIFSAGSEGQAYGVAVSGNTAFVAYFNAGLQIIDVTNTSNPRLLSTFPAGSGFAIGVAVSGNTAFVADNSAGLQIIDITNTSNPIALGIFFAGSVQAYGVAISGNTVFVAYFNAGLQIIDVTNTSNPRLLSTFPAGSASNVAISGNTAFVADWNAGLQIIDVTNTSNPQLLGNFSVGSGPAYSVAVSSNTAFVADDNVGLQILDLTSWQFQAISPSSTDTGNYHLRVVATDVLGGQAFSTTFTVRVEGPPQFNGAIPTQYAKVGRTFNYFIPQGLCADPNLDPISFSAAYQNGPLPGWLRFNGVSATFAGIPGDSDVGIFNVIVNATDNIAGTVTTSFSLSVAHLPIVATPIPQPPPLRAGRYFSFAVPSSTFSDPDSPLVYSASLANGSPLPSWVQFNSSSLTLSGTPTAQNVGSLSLQIAAKDFLNQSTYAPLTLLISQNFLPQVVQPISDQTATVNQAFRFSAPTNTFTALEGDTLFYNTSGMPGWLSFDNTTLTFSGTPGRLDTDSFSSRRVPIALNAYNYPFVYNSYALATFNINVGGTSYAALALSIGGPIFSALTLAYALYKKRALILNHLESRKHSYQKVAVAAVIGETFDYPLETPLKDVSEIRVRSSETKERVCNCFRTSFQKLPGGITMPHWMEYNDKTNHLGSRGPIPAGEERELIVQVKDKNNLIVEEFKLNIANSDLQENPSLLPDTGSERGAEVIIEPTRRRSDAPDPQATIELEAVQTGNSSLSKEEKII